MKTFKKMRVFLSPYKIKLFLASILLLLAAVLTAAAPITEGLMTTQLQRDVAAIAQGVSGARIQYDVLVRIIVVLFAMYLINTGARIAYQYLLSSAIQSAVYDMRMAIKEKMARLPIRYFDANSAGDLMSRMSTDVDAISGTLQQALAQILMALLNILFAIILMVSIDIKMALVAFTLLPLTVIMSRVVVAKSQVLFKKQADALGAMNSVVQEKFTGFNEIKLYNYQENAIEDFAKVNHELCEVAFKANFFSGLMSPAVSLFTYIIIVVGMILLSFVFIV